MFSLYHLLQTADGPFDLKSNFANRLLLKRPSYKICLYIKSCFFLMEYKSYNIKGYILIILKTNTISFGVKEAYTYIKFYIKYFTNIKKLYDTLKFGFEGFLPAFMIRNRQPLYCFQGSLLKLFYYTLLVKVTLKLKKMSNVSLSS